MFGLPGLGFHSQERRIAAPDLHVMLMPLQQASREQAVAGAPARSPSVSSTPPLSRATAAIVPKAKPEPNFETGVTAPTQLSFAAVIAMERADEATWVVPSPSLALKPAIAVAPSASIKETVMPAPLNAGDLAQKRSEPEVREQAVEVDKFVPREREAQQQANQMKARHQEGVRQEAARVEVERLEAARIVAAQLESQRQEIARQDAARIEAARLEVKRLKAVRQAEAQLEAQRREANRQDAARVEVARLEAARIAVAQLEAQRQEAAREEAARIEAGRLEAARIAKAKLDAQRDEIARQEAARIETARLEVIRLEAVQQAEAKLEAQRQEAARKDAARIEAARLEAARLEAARIAKVKLEAQRQEAARQEAARVEAARFEALRLEAARIAEVQLEAQRRQAALEKAARVLVEQEEAKREARLRAIGRQLNESAARRKEASTDAARSHSTLPYSLSTTRRARLWGRTHSNAELVRYAETWARKIQFNTPVDTVREVAKRPHTDPMVTVSIRSDGSVESVTFVLSSGVAEVDEAIRRIVQSHVHYQVFPPELAREFNVVDIRRT
ncbi:MAG: TonB C-terminal domain-containing protein, partial [Pseudomonadota bacterium]|nr:TonB C-terminal domain-containing protein [Pseudomonadota bacterium]